MGKSNPDTYEQKNERMAACERSNNFSFEPIRQTKGLDAMNANSNPRAPIKLAPAAQISTAPDHQQPNSESGFSALLKQLSAGVRKDDVKRREGWRDRNGKTHYVDYVE
jgi:hypothetical protein